MKRVLLVLVAACGGGSGGNTDKPAVDAPDNADPDAAVDAPQGAFTLTSPAFAEGGGIPAAHTCNGANTSPQLVWTAGPAGTASYAVVFTDKSFNNLIHWVIYDIPASATGLPADVQKAYMPNNVTGAKQTTSYQAATRGYLGPCPPNLHTYEFVVYALDVAALPGATMSTDRPTAKSIIEMHDLAMAKLSGTYMQP